MSQYALQNSKEHRKNVSFKDQNNELVVLYDDEAESYIIGAFLNSYSLDNQEDMLATIDEIGLLSVDFWEEGNKILFEIILQLLEAQYKLEPLILTKHLEEKGLLGKVGGIPYLTKLSSFIASSKNISYYARRVKDFSVKRKLYLIGSELAQDCIEKTAEGHLTGRELLDHYEQRMLDLDLNEKTYQFQYTEVSNLTEGLVEDVQSRITNKHKITGIRTGFAQLDELTSGLQNAEFVVVGARPSVGKTAFALSLVHQIALKDKIPCGFFSLEMSNKSILDRLISLSGRISATRLRSGFLTQEEIAKFHRVVEELNNAPLYTADVPSMSLLELRRVARRMVRLNKVKVIFVDYLTLVTLDNSDKPRFEQVAEISRSLKSLARELKIPVVALSQLTRDTENKKPSLANLRESGAIEQDADVVFFLHRDKSSDKDKEAVETELIIAKQRNGPVGDLKIVFLPQYTLFDKLSVYE